MLNTIMFYLMIVAYGFCGVGLIIALGMTIYAMRNDGLTGFGGLVFFVTMYLSWPYIVFAAAADEIKMWWHEHITTEREWRW